MTGVDFYPRSGKFRARSAGKHLGYFDNPEDALAAIPPRENLNVERVRSFVEKNPGCLLKTIYHSLNLHPRTVTKAIRIIREKS